MNLLVPASAGLPDTLDHSRSALARTENAPSWTRQGPLEDAAAGVGAGAGAGARAVVAATRCGAGVGVAAGMDAGLVVGWRTAIEAGGSVGTDRGAVADALRV